MLALGLDRGSSVRAVVPDGLLGGTVQTVDLECGRLMLLDELEGEVGGLEEVRALIERRPPLMPRLEDHLEELVEGLFRCRGPEDRLQLGLVRCLELDAVLFGERLRKLCAGEQTA